MVKHKPDTIVCLGDWADMPSLSQYDRGTKGFEGRRYRKDIESVIDAQDQFFSAIRAHNKQKRKNNEKQYKPKLYMTLGNHEDSIDLAVNAQAELHGTIGMSDLQYEKYGLKCTPFKRSLTLHGISFSHYF